MTTAPLRIGTRGSRLALWQANAVRDALITALRPDAPPPEIVPIVTSGDQVTDRPLREIGGKGLFTKELEQALGDGRIDCAVHSVKDMPSISAPGLGLAACLPRASARDMLVAREPTALAALPKGAVIGTTSLRRQAQLLRTRPDLVVKDLRGNIETRLAKLASGAFDAILLAEAGLDRLGLDPPGAVALSVHTLLPAVGQGAIGIEIRADDAALWTLLRKLNDAPTFDAVTAERAYLTELGGSCRSPIAGHAWLDGDTLNLRALVASPDGTDVYEAHHHGPRAWAANQGVALAELILEQTPDAFVEAYLSDD